MHIRIILMMIILSIFSTVNSAIAQPVFGISFPPTGSSRTLNFSVKTLPEIDVSYIRIAEQWKNREPKKGVFNWKPLENRIGAFEKNNIKILLTIQIDGPDWACAKRNSKSCLYKDWKDIEPYLNELLKRFGDRLDAIQLGNEWDYQYVGTAKQYSEFQNKFYKVVKKSKPKLNVVLGGITTRAYTYEAICERSVLFDQTNIKLKNPTDLNKALKQDTCVRKKQDYAIDRKDVRYVLSNANYDIVDIHLYDLPELWPIFIKILSEDANKKPIYVTEFGGPNPDFEIYNPKYQAERLQTYLEVIKKLPISRAYFFKLTDGGSAYHNFSGLFDKNGKEKPALKVFLNR